MTIEQTIDILPNRRLEMDLPFELPLGRAKIELIITPETRDFSNKGKPVNHSAYGLLKAYANPALIQEEEGVWEKAAAEKYAQN
jgi:hypothetical protein